MNRINGHMIKLENLHIGYFHAPMKKKNTVYGPINIEIKPAEMIGIIGRNGIGKSTLLRTIAGLQSQLSGKVIIDGIESTRIAKKDLSKLISYVSTEAINVQNLRVMELVAMGRFPHTGWFGKLTSDDLRAIHEAIEHTGVMHLAQKSVYQLSDGERQKVMIARALAQNTPVIILDEPTAFLDLPARHEILRLLNDLTHRNNKTIVFSTHDLSIAMDEADKLWLMTDEGVFEGAPEDLLINQLFRKLFINSLVEFDPDTSSFRFKRELNKFVRIHGEKTYCLLTIKALERIGYQAVEDDMTEFDISVRTIDNVPVWCLKKEGTDTCFNSIYELTSHLKNVF
jgi:iron complex transport system ATP-binding protein